MVVGQWAGNKPVRGRVNMQVVSVGGKGRGKELTVKGRGGKKVTTNRTQTLSSSPPSSSPPKLTEDTKAVGRPAEGTGTASQQLNGSSSGSATGQALDLPPLAQPIQCALASRDNQSGDGVEVEAPCCLDDCPSDGALQKEE